MEKVKVSLRPLVTKLNLPTVLKTAILPGESTERLFIATQIGEIYYIGNGMIGTFLDIRPLIIKLGVSRGGYDERGLLGLAFHPDFHNNGLFYLHYSVAGTQGPGALSGPFRPDPCNPETLNLKWENREVKYNHIDTVEEWIIQSGRSPRKRRTLLNIRRPFMNHNGVNSLNFSPETGRLILTTGDGGLGYDPFNLSQDDMEIAGKIIGIDTSMNTSIENPPVASRFSELPEPLQESLTVIAKGVRNMPGISFQKFDNRCIKVVGNVGQDLVESIFSFDQYRPIPATQITQASSENNMHEPEGFINLGWRGWEGDFPTSIIKDCKDSDLEEKTTAYYYEAIAVSTRRLPPLTCYYHDDPRPGKFEATALTGVHPYMGTAIADLTGSIVFTDLARDHEHNEKGPARGALAYTRLVTDCQLNDYSVIDIDYDFGTQSAFFVSLGTNLDQSRLYLGVYGSMNVADYYQGTVFEIVP